MSGVARSIRVQAMEIDDEILTRTSFGLLHTWQQAGANGYSHCDCCRLFHSAARNRHVTTCHIGYLNIRVLAERYDLSLEPGIIIAQTPQSGERVDCGTVIGVTMSSEGPGKKQFSPELGVYLSGLQIRRECI